MYWKETIFKSVLSYYENEFGVMIDEVDMELVKGKRISLFSNGYARIFINGRGQVGLHRAIMGFPEFHIDHVNGNRKDNRRSNLRTCNKFQNGANLKINRKNKINKSSIFKGVRFFKRDRTWSAQIHINYKSIHLGYFKEELDAARAYDSAAIKYWGEFAKTNFKL